MCGIEIGDGEGRIGLEIKAVFIFYSMYFYIVHLKSCLNTLNLELFFKISVKIVKEIIKM